MEKKTIYILQLEWRTDGVTEFEVEKVFDSLEIGKKYFKTERDDIVYDYTNEDNDFHIEEESETYFMYQKDDYDEYYELALVSKEVTNE